MHDPGEPPMLHMQTNGIDVFPLAPFPRFHKRPVDFADIVGGRRRADTVRTMDMVGWAWDVDWRRTCLGHTWIVVMGSALGHAGSHARISGIVGANDCIWGSGQQREAGTW